MHDLDYETLTERVELGLAKRRRLAQLIMSGVGTIIPVLMVITGLLLAEAGETIHMTGLLGVALFFAVLMNFFTLLLALGVFDANMRGQVLNEEMSAHLLEQRQQRRSEKAKRSLEDLDEDVILAEDGELLHRSLQS